jgi:hypothetical protein
MEKIKQQIEKLIVFNATSLADLSTEFETLKDRLNQGLENMGDSQLFSPKEISEIKTFANQLLITKHSACKQAIINKGRETFVF